MSVVSVLTHSTGFVNCPKYRNNKKKYKLNKQQIFERNRQNLKSSWNTKKECQRHQYVKTNAFDIHTTNDFISYSEFQLVSWVLPMTIAGRVMNLSYESIIRGLLIIAIIKSLLSFYNIIHY